MNRTFYRHMPLTLGFLNATVSAGPFAESPNPGNGWFTMRLTGEVAKKASHDFLIPDFKVPTKEQMDAALTMVIGALMSGRAVYLGCWGGMGRTGTVLACLHKVQQEYEKLTGLVTNENPVAFVRREYWDRAVESTVQHEFIAAYDASDVLLAALDAEKAKFGKNKAGYWTVTKFRIGRRIDALMARAKTFAAKLNIG